MVVCLRDRRWRHSQTQGNSSHDERICAEVSPAFLTTIIMILC